MDFVIEHFAGDPAALLAKPLTMPRLNFHPDGLISSMSNPEEAFGMQRGRVHRYLEASEFEYESMQMVKELEALRPDVLSPSAAGGAAENERPHLLIPIQLQRGKLHLNVITVVATLGWTQDITLEELHVEYGFPADDASNAFLQEAQRNGWSLPA